MNKESLKKRQKFLQSNVYTEFGSFFVSTGYRESSACVESPPWYFETFAWQLDSNNKKLNLIADNSGSCFEKGVYKQHIEVCTQLHETGRFENIEKIYESSKPSSSEFNRGLEETKAKLLQIVIEDVPHKYQTRLLGVLK